MKWMCFKVVSRVSSGPSSDYYLHSAAKVYALCWVIFLGLHKNYVTFYKGVYTWGKMNAHLWPHRKDSNWKKDIFFYRTPMNIVSLRFLQTKAIEAIVNTQFFNSALGLFVVSPRGRDFFPVSSVHLNSAASPSQNVFSMRYCIEISVVCCKAKNDFSYRAPDLVFTLERILFCLLPIFTFARR